jgi:hypothetical protein
LNVLTATDGRTCYKLGDFGTDRTLEEDETMLHIVTKKKCGVISGIETTENGEI